MATDKVNTTLGRPTALIFGSMLFGQGLNFAALSLYSAWLGLEGFGKYGICLLDFTAFCNLAGFALPAASITMAVQANFRDRVFSLVMGTRWWTAWAAIVLYLLFEFTFREREIFLAALVLAPTILFNPMQLEWWFVARKSWREIIVYRCMGGIITLGATFLWVHKWPSLASAAAAYGAGALAATVYLLVRAARDKEDAQKPFDLRLPWSRIGTPRMLYLWGKSLPLALAGVFDFLFLPLGLYAFKAMHGDAQWLGGYSAAYRLILGASLFASAQFLVLLPSFSKPKADFEKVLGKTFDRTALILILPWLSIPFLAAPILRLMFPHTGWDKDAIHYAAWCFSVMALATYLHLLRMPPLTRMLASGATWSYFRRFITAGLINGLAVGIGILVGKTAWLPLWALTGEFVFTSGWLLTLYPKGSIQGWGRVIGLAIGSIAYLLWVSYNL